MTIFFYNGLTRNPEIGNLDFSDYCCSSPENENTLAIERRMHFTEAAIKRCYSNLCLVTFIKII